MAIDMKLYHTHTCLPLMYIRGIRKFVHIIDKGPYSLQCRYHFLNVSRPRKSIPYRIGRYGQYIPYQPVHQYRCPSCFVPKKIPAVSASYWPCRRNSAILAINGYRVKIEKSQRKFSWIFRTYPKLLHLVGAGARAGATPPPTTTDNPNPLIQKQIAP